MIFAKMVGAVWAALLVASLIVWGICELVLAGFRMFGAINRWRERRDYAEEGRRLVTGQGAVDG